MKFGQALCVGIGAVVAVTLVGCGGGSKPTTPQCSLNSDCAKLSTPGLICALGYCVRPCNISSDCPNNERCVVVGRGADGGTSTGGADAGVAQGTACQAPETVTCNYNSACKAPLVCSSDHQCRDMCETNVDCPGMGMGPGSQVCTSMTHLCADPILDKDYNATINDFVVNDAGVGIPQGGTGGSGTENGGTSGSGGSGGVTVNACPTPQTTFPNVFQGTANTNFTSGVAVRSGGKLYIFSGYSGPVPTSADAGTNPDAAVVNGNFVYLQTFNIVTGMAAGPAAPLFQIEENAYEPYFYVQDVAVAPTGEIVLLHGHGTPGDGTETQLFASFFSVGATQDAGSAGLQVGKTVQIESVQWASPHATWSTAGSAFVLSWRNLALGTLRVRKFLPDGSAAGGDTNQVPTVSLWSTYDQGHAGTSKSLIGVIYGSNSPYNPYLTLLGADGNQVGDSIKLSSIALSGNADWLTVGGTTMGFATLFHEGGITHEVFVPTSDKGVVTADAGAGADAGDGGTALAPTFTGFSFSSTATTAHAISDDTGGQGGVGVVLLEGNGASFLYVTADGSQHVAAGTVLSSATGFQVAIANYRGSFSISLHDSAKHATQASVSGCKK